MIQKVVCPVVIKALTLTQLSLTRTHCITWRKLFQVLLRHHRKAYMGTETLAGQRHRHGVLWVITGLGCERSRVQIPGGDPICEGVSIGWDRLETSCSVRVMHLLFEVVHTVLSPAWAIFPPANMIIYGPLITGNTEPNVNTTAFKMICWYPSAP